MQTISTVTAFLEEFAPPRLAAEWDNVGLLVGDGRKSVERIMTCLTLTPESVAEAIAQRAQLVVTHHPFPFKPLRRITAETREGRLLLDLIGAGVAVYSPHTAFDSAKSGINQRLAEGLGLADIGPLEPDTEEATVGTGRFGFPSAQTTLAGVAARVKDFLNLPAVQMVGDPQSPVRAVAVACGSAGELIDAALHAGCDCFVTGEARFHTCLEAEAAGIGVILAGHFASERFAVERLAELLGSQFRGLHVFASQQERDPLRWA